jgi:hypothetical protein
MPTATATEPVVHYGQGYCATPCLDNTCIAWDIIVPPQELILEPGEFVIQSVKGLRYICTLTGRQRWINSNWRAVTIHVHDVDTVVRPLADGSPALWGVRGQRRSGTWAINRRALTEAGEALLR